MQTKIEQNEMLQIGVDRKREKKGKDKDVSYTKMEDNKRIH